MSQTLGLVCDVAVMFQGYLESQSYHGAVGMFPFPRQTLLVAEPLFIFTVFFIFLTMASTLLYYKRVRQASKAYEEAKNTVSDIVISFDKQLSRQEEEVGVAMQKIEVQAARGEKLSRRLDEQEDRITTGLGELSSKVQTLPEVESVKTVLSGLTEKVEGLARAQEEWKKRAISVTESQIEAAIPLKREQALAPLTDTELRVLEFIATSPSGERTAPEVQEIIRLTREHTARLMKKLYEGGYLERRDAKTPYAYRVKEEMLRMLKKSEAKA